MRTTTQILASTATALVVFGTANAAEVLVSSSISTSTTWSKNNTYNLQQQIYVLPGATLTIEPGTVIRSTAGLGGSLAVCAGAKIIAEGTADEPIIFTSTNDNLTTWRVAANEWGNLTIMGRGYISETAVAGNTAAPGNNIALMEGLVPDFAGDTKVQYGGTDDNDDSGVLKYVSFRYGGKVIGLNNELNGLSLGGVGRGTDIEFVEIMNNVDDGIEIWGGTVNLKHFSIWNVGDDSLDIDQGWRGQGQFGLIVQGYSTVASQGSGVGDNCLEMDGAENDTSAQPVTTGCLYNLTVIGQPASGDHGAAFRDNANMQIRNSIFMNIGEQVVKNDNIDGDGGLGYGYNGTLSWAARWTTPSTTTSTINAFANPAQAYQAQLAGNLIEITDSVFNNNLFSSGYTEANARGVFSAGNNNVIDNAANPVVSITRGAPVTVGTLIQVPVTSLDPRAAGSALTAVNAAPDTAFFDAADYRGAFSATENWLCGWSASTQFGLVPNTNCPVAGNPADLNGDGSVDGADLAILLGAWGQAGGDVDGDGTTGGADLSALLGSFGS